jgi:acetate---CoA ligase (ADP-forming)
MPDHITGERLTSLFRPRSVALVGASDKSAFSQIAYRNLVQFGYAGQMFVDAIGAGMRAASCPAAYVNQVMQPVTGYTRTSMEQGGVPYVIPGLRQAVVALRNVAWWSEATRVSGGSGPPPRAARLAASSPPEPAGPPTPGRRLLDVPADEDAVRAAYQAVIAAAPDSARIEGVLVSRLLDRLRGRAVLDGVRGAAPADRDALAAVIARIGDLALALGDSLGSLEVNPLLVDGARIEALDAILTWREHS